MGLVLGLVAEILHYHYNNKFDSYLDIDDIECIKQTIRPASGVHAAAAAHYEDRDFINPTQTVNLKFYGSPPDLVQEMTAATGATTGAGYEHKHADKVQKESISLETFIDKICDIINHPTLKIFILSTQSQSNSIYQHQHK